MDQPVGRTTRLRLYPIRPLWSLGAGWAAISGGLAAGGFAFSSETWAQFLLVWLLADPLLGVVWDAGAGSASSGGQRGIWHRLLNPELPEMEPPGRLLPYTQAGSPGYWLAHRLSRLFRWWRDTFWPEAGREFATLVAGLGSALLLGAVLGRDVLVLVLASTLLSWLAVLSQEGDTAADWTEGTSGRRGILTLWHALGEFGVPWLIGASVMGGASQAVILLGICYTITYFGLTHPGAKFRLVGASQATTALLLAGLRHPMTAGVTAVLLLPQWGLFAWAGYALSRQPPDLRPSPEAGWTGAYPRAPGESLRYAQPFVILGMLIAALALAS